MNSTPLAISRSTTSSLHRDDRSCTSIKFSTVAKPGSGAAPDTRLEPLSSQLSRRALASAVKAQFSSGWRSSPTGSTAPGITDTGPSSARKASRSSRSADTVTSSSSRKQARASRAYSGPQATKNRLTPSAFNFSLTQVKTGLNRTAFSISGFPYSSGETGSVSNTMARF